MSNEPKLKISASVPSHLNEAVRVCAERWGVELQRFDSEAADLYVLGMDQPGLMAQQVAELVRCRSPRPRVIVILPNESLWTPDEAIRIGVFDLLHEPVHLGSLENSLERALFGPALASCREIEVILDHYYRRALDVPDSFEVREHLTRCAGCRSLLVQMVTELNRA